MKSFAESDAEILAALEQLSQCEVDTLVSKVMARGYEGEDLSLVVDVINDKFSQNHISVYDDSSHELMSSKAVLFLEEHCDHVLALAQYKS